MRKIFFLAVVLMAALSAQATRKDIGTLANGSTYTAQNGDELYGTISGKDVTILIAKNATVTLDGVSINRNHEIQGEKSHAGISTLGDATIVIRGTNYVCGFGSYEPGIYPAKNATLTFSDALSNGTLYATSGKGQYGLMAAGIGAGRVQQDKNASCGAIRIVSGTIVATGGSSAAGIGGAAETSCGDIRIQGGTITAIGGSYAAGIGSGCHTELNTSNTSECGDIIITQDVYAEGGGNIPTIVTATGGEYGAGIGCGSNGKCGTITIKNIITRVTATKGLNALCSVGKGYEFNYTSTCGTITIGGTVYPNGVTESPFVYPTPSATCQAATNVKVSNITATSAVVTWTDGNANSTSFDVCYMKHLAAGYYYETTTAKSYTLTGLTPNTEYDVWIETTCGAGNYSENSTTVRFTTLKGTEGIEDIFTDSPAANKLIRNGQIFIHRGDKTYTLQGQEVK